MQYSVLVSYAREVDLPGKEHRAVDGFRGTREDF